MQSYRKRHPSLQLFRRFRTGGPLYRKNPDCELRIGIDIFRSSARLVWFALIGKLALRARFCAPEQMSFAVGNAVWVCGIKDPLIGSRWGEKS